MSHVLAILIGAVITALFSGIILESYKRHRDLQGVASAVAGEIYSIIHMTEKRETAAHFARLLAQLESGQHVDWTDVTGGDPAQDDPVIKAHLERIGSLPDGVPERIATFYTYLRGIRIDIQNLAKGAFKERQAQAAIIRADLILWADATREGKELWADLRKVANSQWWLSRHWQKFLTICRRVLQWVLAAYHKCLAQPKGATSTRACAQANVATAAPQPIDTRISADTEALPDSPLTAQVFAAPYQELAIHIAADTDNTLLPSILPNFGGDREQALRYSLIDFRSAVFLERASRFLFGSQIDALIFLGANSGRSTIGELQRYYAAGVTSAPGLYTNYSFDNWLGFLAKQELVTRESDIVSLLPAGKAIISYMQMRGYLRFRARG